MSDRPAVIELLLAQREAWRRGQRPSVEDYLARHPLLRGDAEAMLDLIYNEMVLREEAGEVVDPQSYLQRFPDLAGPLRAQFEVEAALGRAELLDGQGSTIDHQSTRARPAVALPRLEGCDVLDELGHGAMGVVYRGWQRANQRPVAIKLLAADVPAGRVATEAAAASRLHHPNIVQVFEVKELEGRTALVLEYVEGGNLAQKLAGKPQPPRECARLVETLAWAMAYAHGRGVIHRDLKPSNVLLSAGPDEPLRTCVPKIGDFGLAKLIESTQHLTATNDILGTPSYMAPEQTGKPNVEVGPATDVYALGAILYECLTGRPPFLGETVLGTLEQVRHQDPVPPSQLLPRLPRDLDVVALKCLHKQPERRYATARDLAEDLRRFQAGEPIRARPVGLPERSWKWARRRPALALLLLVSLLTASGFLVAGIVVNQMLRQQRDLARRQAEQLDGQLRHTRRLLYTAQLLRVGSVWESDPVQALRMLEDREACPPDLRCLSWRLLHGQCHRFRLALPLSTAEVTALARYPRGQLLASGDAQGRVRLWDLSSGQEASTLGPAETAITSLAFSADGLLLAAGTDSGQVMLWEMPAGVARASLTLGGRVGALAWHPDGRTLAVVAGSRAAQVSLWDARARRQRRLLRGEVHPLTGLAFSPDGRLIAAAGNDHQLWIWDERTGKSGKPLRGHLAPVSGLAFTPDGNRLVSGGRDGAVRVWDLLRETELASLVTRPVAALAMHPTAPTAILATTPRDADDTGPDLRLLDVDTGREIEPMRGHLGGSTAVAFAADGATLATAGLDRTLRVWDFPPRRAQLRLRGQVGTSASVALDRPGRVLAWLSRGDAMTGPATEIVLAEAETGQSLQTLRAQGRPMQAFALSGDGRLVAGAAGHPGEPAELLVWDVSTGRLLQALRGHQGEVVSLVFSPDGRRLASAGTGGPVRLWDVPAGTAVGTLETPARSPGVLAWDGGLLVAACEAGPGKGTLLVWEAASGGLLHQLELGVQPRTLALSARHGLAVVAGQGDRVELFEVQVGELRARLAAGIKDVTHLALSRDAQSLLLAGAAEGVKLWDLPSGQERLSLPGHRGGACFAALADGDRFLLTVGTAQVARLWYAGVPR